MYIKVRVKTGEKKESVEKISPTSLKISVKEKPEKNSANARIIKIIAEQLGVAPKKVRIVSGHHTPSKLLAITE